MRSYRFFPLALALVALALTGAPAAGAQDASGAALRAPERLTLVWTTRNVVIVGWIPRAPFEMGKRRVLPQYGLYLDGRLVGSTIFPWAIFSGLACGTTHRIGVDVVDPDGNRSPQSVLSATTSACPRAPRDLKLSGATTKSLSLAWSPTTERNAHYGVYRDGARVASTVNPSATLSGLLCGKTYALAVDVVDADGNRSQPSTLGASTTACPSPPGDLRLTGATKTSLTIAWTAPTGQAPFTYELSRDGGAAGTTADTSAELSGLECGKTYELGVVAVDADGNRSEPATIHLSTTGCPVSTSDLYLSPTGSDDNACTLTEPCFSFDRAYHEAQPGQTVVVLAGSYPSQTISADPTKTSSDDVLFRPALGAGVRVGEVHIDASHLELRDMSLWDGLLIREGADGVTIRDTWTASLFIWSASNVKVIGGELYPGPDYLTGCTQDTPTCDWDSQITSACDGCAPPTNILIDGLKVHGFLRPPDTDFHTECLQVGSGVNVTIRNSSFWDCATHDLFIRSWGDTYPLRDWTIENNFFGQTHDGFYAVYVAETTDSTYENIVLRNNSSLDGFNTDVQVGSVKFISNILPEMSDFLCGYSAAATWDYNLYESGTPCGAHDVVGDPLFRDRLANDLHLLPGSPAIDAGDPAGPAGDIDGQARPLGAGRDIGADEAG
jgi:hypothetical protein